MTEVMDWAKFSRNVGDKPEQPFRHTAADIFKARQIVSINNAQLIKTKKNTQVMAVPTDELCYAFSLAITNTAPADGDTYTLISVNGVSVKIEREQPVMRVEKPTNQLDLIKQIEEVQSEKTESL